MPTLAQRVVARYSQKHYRVDRSEVRNELRRYHDVIKESKRDYGAYQKATYEIVPISKIQMKAKWHPDRGPKIQQALDKGKPLPPVELSKEGSRYFIDDGIHRINVSLENGYTHIPAIVTEWIETPDAKVVIENSDRREDGRWVQLHKSMDGREFGWIDDHLTTVKIQGAMRHRYSVALIKRGDGYPEFLDLNDTEFTAGRVRPPSWAARLRTELDVG